MTTVPSKSGGQPTRPTTHGDTLFEIASFQGLDAFGSVADAKMEGKVHMKGKEHVIVDCDVVEFRTGMPSGTRK